MSTIPSNIGWALSGNADITRILQAKYPPSHGYWTYLEDLVSNLRNANVTGIQEKISDVNNNLRKFRAAISEFEIAKVLVANGKQVQLLPDSFMPGKSPDMLLKDSSKEYYVEVTQLSDDEAVTIILDGLRAFLDDPSKAYRVDVTLPEDLTLPVVNYRERQIKEDRANKIVAEFKSAFPRLNLANLPVTYRSDGVEFKIVQSGMTKGYPGFIDTSVIVVPSHKYVERIRYLVTKKAEKRLDWTGDHLKKPYLVAIDCEQVFLFEEDCYQALLGSRTTYHDEPLVLVNQAAGKGWKDYLVNVHFIPADRTMFTSYGIYLTRSICQNVSGVLVRRDRHHWFIPNPFAYDEINDPSLADFIR